MQSVADPQLPGQSVPTNTQQQSTSSPPYYGGDQQNAQVASQPLNIANDGSLTNSIVSSPISPHMQQNGYGNGTTNTANITGNGQIPSFPPQQGAAPHNGAQGTWSGQHTLTYAPDPRNSHTNYCEYCARQRHHVHRSDSVVQCYID